jgi:hypothetical protein
VIGLLPWQRGILLALEQRERRLPKRYLEPRPVGGKSGHIIIDEFAQ